MDGEIQLNEFRQDLVSGEWVLFATGRVKRPGHKTAESKNDGYQPKEGCPFENLRGSGNEILWFYPNESNWEIAVIKNKYPAVISGACNPGSKSGPFDVHGAVGDHDVIVYKNHDMHFADFSVDQLTSVIHVFKKRYNEILKNDGECLRCIMLFHNFGQDVGASLYHPHSQIISMPILPPDIERSLRGAQRFYKENNRRVYDAMINWEVEQGKRIIYENDFFIAFCPFVSKYPYEVRIFAKDSHAHFEKMPDPLNKHLADSISVVLRKIKKALDDPAYNFFIHTASIEEDSDAKFHEFYTWHVEIVPKLSITGGFEVGSGVYVNVVDPDDSAKLLRETSV